MVVYPTFSGRAFALNQEYPVYDDEGTMIEHTKKGDVAVVTFDNKNDEDLYLELTVATGEFAGYDGLALNMEDIKNVRLLTCEKEIPTYVRHTKFL